ncbi:MAG: RagB/SusD family nutrient uptake outer membrane protein [Cruoricaptor ignavus]|nr:RagB/SusD family nutrient uptake outer membrane protein [Cruoricaptor ignavus]
MKKILIIISSVVLLQSCKDFLSREPVEQISINTQLSTKRGVLEALNGAYVTYRSSILFYAKFSYGDLLSGNLGFSPNPSGSNAGVIAAYNQVDLLYNFDDVTISSELNSFYTTSYQAINNINLILQYVDELADATTNEKNQIKAECLALRASLHFELLKIYSQNYTYTADASHLGIIYNTAPVKVGIDYPARKTVAESADLLVEDITNAIELFTDNKALPVGLDKNFMSRNAAKMIASEIYLWKNDWQNAFDVSNDLILNSGISLASSSDYTTSWALAESVLELTNNKENNSSLEAIYNYDSQSSYSKFAISNDVYSLFDNNDLRLNLYEQQSLNTRLSSGNQNLPYTFTKKYKMGVAGLVYRITEAYFIRAESALNLGNTSQALQDINSVRQRAGLQNITSLSIDDLLIEKRKEFLCENKYFFDLMRYHKNIVREDGCISNNCNPTYPFDKFVAPIPQNAIEYNGNMVQNPSY